MNNAISWRLHQQFYRFTLLSYIRIRKFLRSAKYMDTQILFFPEYPADYNYVVHKFVSACGVRMRPFSRIHLYELSDNFLYRQYLKLRGVNSGKSRIFIYAFEDNTRSLIDVEKFLAESEGIPPADANITYINTKSGDISKQKVTDCMQKVFGYSSLVDPMTFDQKMVRKSDTNGIHDGEILQGPISKEDYDELSVYQQIIDNSVENEMVQDLRVVMVGKQVPVLYRKRRPMNDRFSNTNTITYLEKPEDYFSQEELENLAKFTAAFNLDVCEMDVLRDNGNKQIYVVDVNRTVSGPPNQLSLGNAITAVGRIADAFEAEFLAKK